ncbi:class I adenylate-forming enzyme family protein [Cellulosilyticum lentocellum]|uniref:O-succinylbenzoate--CoA ligase n=1 Tax=Cellulosilyticum lentocellum (strain ATCC 49066 / DSM 5427 / NCIMB 11756 / RHM5) TaxID=642492 RepID=F2JJG5_CELLD|nr:class I adenylate-forming enzyme family protein [Cellulosilyticum lentocellum]ADZ85560.1 o-succinylbenzoate--CoA ligase [Cellulosilyticum lentocellum DSM 5427]
MNLSEYLLKHQYSDRIAVKYKEQAITYRHLNQKCYALSEILTQETSELIGLFIPNSINYVIGYYGILYAGKIIVSFNTQLTENEVLDIMTESQTQAIVTLSEYREKFQNLEKQMHIIYIDELPLEISTMPSEIVLENQGDGNQGAIIFPTSGTTGDSKLVMHSHNHLAESIVAFREYIPMTEEDISLIIVPLCAAFINVQQLLFNICIGLTSIMYDGKIRINKFFNIVDTEKVTSCAMVPSLLKSIATSYDPMRHQIASLECVLIGGEKIDEETFNLIKEKIQPTKMLQLYGMSEAAAICHKKYDDWDHKGESVGKAFKNVQIKIVDDQGKSLPNNVPGEIIIKSPYIMLGYYGREGALSEDGWFRTGDIGEMDEEGYVWIKGRKKNVIISGGRNIFPEEVEFIIQKHEMISEIKVYAEVSKSVGEIVVAEVVIAPGKVFDLQVLLDYCKGVLASYKTPKKFYCVDSIEKTASNKIKRR